MLTLKRRNHINIEIPIEPLRVIGTLQCAGFEAFLVGGCVRDCLMKKTPNDWDITTNAEASEVKKMFPKSFETGIQHGTITVLQDGMEIEVTTYRIDGEYKDFRRPEQVLFTKNLEDDLSRRDFTINAMAYHPDAGLIDLFHGQADLEKGIVRTVGDADKRFHEDALRIMRCVRFALCLGFDIEPNTYDALKRNVELLNHIAIERIREEMNKMLLCDGKLALLYESDILKQILPEVDHCFAISQDNPRHVHTVGEHILLTTRLIRNDLILRWTAFLHDIGKQDCKTFDEEGYGRFYGHNEKSYERAKDILNRFKFDNKTKNEILTLIKNHDLGIELIPYAVKQVVRSVGKDLFPLLLEHKRADAKAASPALFEERLAYLDQLEQIYLQVKDDPIELKDLAVRGSDLNKLGFHGKEIGVILERLLDIVIQYPQENAIGTLLSKAERLRRQHEKI